MNAADNNDRASRADSGDYYVAVDSASGRSWLFGR